MAVNGDDSVGVFVNNGAFWVHAESADKVAVFLGAVNDLAFIKFVGKVRKNLCRKFNANADINAVGLGGDTHFLANFFHPFASASANGNNAFFAGVNFFCGYNFIAVFGCLNGFNGSVKEKVHSGFKIFINVFKDDIVDVGSEMTNGSIKKVKVVLDAKLFKLGAGGGIKFGAFAAVSHVYFVNIAHKVKSMFFADIFIKGAAKIVGDVVFSVRKSARTAKTAHNGTGFAVNAAFYFFTVDGAAAFFKGMSRFKNGNFKFGRKLGKLVSGKNTAGTRTDYNNVIIHFKNLRKAKFYRIQYIIKNRIFQVSEKNKNLELSAKKDIL